MKLIVESIEDVEFLVESDKKGNKSHYIKGIFLQTDIKNRNGRYYSFPIVNKEVERYNKNYISQGRAVGELGHPSSPTVNLDRVSHKIVELKPDGKNFIGKAKLLNTPMGNIAISLVNEGVKLGVSSRGIGTLEEKNGVKYVKDDFMLSTAADIVADPSAPDAFVESIMEGKDWIYDSVKNEFLIDNTKKYINNSPMNLLEERKLKAFNRFLNSL